MRERPKLRLVSSDPVVVELEAVERRASEVEETRRARPAAERVSVALGAVEHLDMMARDRLTPADAFDRLGVPLGWDLSGDHSLVTRPEVRVLPADRGEVRKRVRRALEAQWGSRRSIVDSREWSRDLDDHVRAKALEAFRRELVRLGVEGERLEVVMRRVQIFIGWVHAVGVLQGERAGRTKLRRSVRASEPGK